MSRAAKLVACVAHLMLAFPGAGQTVLVQVQDEETRTPIFGALTYLVGADGATVRNALTDERGRALFVGMGGGEYRVRVEMIGMATQESAGFSVAVDQTVRQEVVMTSSAITLEDIQVEAQGDRCRVRASRGEVVAEVWEEARKALAAAAFTDSESVYRYQTMTYVRDLERDARTVVDEERTLGVGYQRTPFESRPAEDLIENGFMQASPDGDIYYAPDANVLLSDAFLDTHCFRLRRGDADDELLGLVFEPISSRRSIPDIAGTLWLDAVTAELRWMEFTYRNLDTQVSTDNVGGRVAFRRLPNGTWIVPEWWIRMPTTAVRRDFRGRQELSIESYREVGGIVQRVQESGGRTLLEAESATVEGLVVDSLGVEPLQGAQVGVAGSRQTVFTNAQGRFRITGLTGGVYPLRFSHAAWEEYGFEPEPVTYEVANGEVTAVRYTMPAMGAMLARLCPLDSLPEGTTALAGRVRDPSGRGVAGATVRATWSGFTIPSQRTGGRDVLVEQQSGLEVLADSDGVFHVCGVPIAHRFDVEAVAGEVRSDTQSMRIAGHVSGGLAVLEIPRR